MRLGRRLCTNSFFFFFWLAAFAANAKQTIYIGAGDDNCIYATVAYQICEIVDQSEVLNKDYICTVVQTSGSMVNLQGLATRRLDLAIAQSDMLMHAINGTSHFSHLGASPDLGILLPLYPEPFSILVRDDSDIHSLEDLQGKRINIGKPYGDQRNATELVMRLKGLSRSDFASLREDDTDEALFYKLCNKRIDAVVAMSGHPVVNYKNMMEDCDLRLLPLDNKLVKQVLALETLLFPTEVNSRIYNRKDESNQTFAALAYLVASEDLDPYFSHNLLVALGEQENKLRTSHPVMRNFSVNQTPFTKNLPLHSAAVLYFGTSDQQS
jgi:hypothetical protein